MDDLISRAWLLSEYDKRHKGPPGGARKLIEEAPSAEPKIIRCKDCKNWDTTWTNDFSPNYHYCPMVDGVRKEDWFCADAERREDG